MKEELGKILDRLAKLKALAERGVGGERHNAAVLLGKVAAKYGVDLDSLGQGEAEEREHWIDAKRGWRLALFAQLCGLMRIDQYGDVHAEHCNLYTRKEGSRCVGCFVKCTDAQFVELAAKYDVLARDYERQRRVFYRAFLEANDLLTPFDGDAPPPPQEELEDAEIASRMSIGIKKSLLHKQIEGGVA